MIERLAAASLMLLGAIPGDAQPHDALRQAMANYERAQIGADRAALNGLLADDYLLVNSGGDREDKKTFIADLVDPTFKLKPYTIEHPVIRRWRGGAVSAGIAHETGTSTGKSFDACIRFADTWKKVGGRWEVAFTQVAKMPPPTATGCGT